ncbi:MAG: hypothetical protein ABIW47_18740, partial [Ginsengibacter sp.]
MKFPALLSILLLFIGLYAFSMPRHTRLIGFSNFGGDEVFLNSVKKYNLSPAPGEGNKLFVSGLEEMVPGLLPIKQMNLTSDDIKNNSSPKKTFLT